MTAQQSGRCRKSSLHMWNAACGSMKIHKAADGHQPESDNLQWISDTSGSFPWNHCLGNRALPGFLLLLAFFGRYAQSSLHIRALNINTPKKRTFLPFCKIGNYEPRSDAEMSVQPRGVAAKWFMVLYLLVGRWAHGVEWVLRRARPPTLIFQNWATHEQTLTLLTLNKTSILLHFVGLA